MCLNYLCTGGHTAITFGDLVKLTSDSEDNAGVYEIGYPFEGFGMKPLRCVQLNLASCDQVILTAAQQALKSQSSKASTELEPRIQTAIEKGRADYADFMAGVNPFGHTIDHDRGARNALRQFEQAPNIPQNFIKAVLKASMRTSGYTEHVTRLFQEHAHSHSEGNLARLSKIDTAGDLSLLALSKGHFGRWVLKEAVEIDRQFRAALLPDFDEVDELAKTYLEEYAAIVKAATLELDKAKPTLGPVKPV